MPPQVPAPRGPRPQHTPRELFDLAKTMLTERPTLSGPEFQKLVGGNTRKLMGAFKAAKFDLGLLPEATLEDLAAPFIDMVRPPAPLVEPELDLESAGPELLAELERHTQAQREALKSVVERLLKRTLTLVGDAREQAIHESRSLKEHEAQVLEIAESLRADLEASERRNSESAAVLADRVTELAEAHRLVASTNDQRDDALKLRDEAIRARDEAMATLQASLQKAAEERKEALVAAEAARGLAQKAQADFSAKLRVAEDAERAAHARTVLLNSEVTDLRARLDESTKVAERATANERVACEHAARFEGQLEEIRVAHSAETARLASQIRELQKQLSPAEPKAA